jgi:hypothetical protein
MGATDHNLATAKSGLGIRLSDRHQWHLCGKRMLNRFRTTHTKEKITEETEGG